MVPAHYKSTTTAEIDNHLQTLKNTFLSQKTKTAKFRSDQLKRLFDGITDYKEIFNDSLAADFGKPRYEVNLTELNSLLTEIIEVLAALPKFMADEKGDAAFPYNLTQPKIKKEPLGTALIIGAWNYPLYVTFGPLIGALAAGCTAIIKPSELAPYTAVAMQAMIAAYLDPSAYRVVLGAVDETTHLLKQKFDTIFYTGGGAVGRIVAGAAAKNLTPVTLELGGKNACVITKNADLKLAARRIAWGKTINAGQTCVAPDFILFTDPSLEQPFIAAWKKVIESFYPKDSWQTPGVYTRIVNSAHFERIKKLLDSTSGKIVSGGNTDAKERCIEPTLVADCTTKDSLMSQEIFGPVLPILHVSSVAEAVSLLNGRDKSLALYVFSNDKKEQDTILDSVSSGGAMVNDVMIHCAITGLPFGGVGESGTGAHNGLAGFNAFTHRRTVVRQPGWMEYLLGIRYAPFTDSKAKQFAMMAPSRYWDPKTLKEPGLLIRLFKLTGSLGVLFLLFRLYHKLVPSKL